MSTTTLISRTSSRSSVIAEAWSLTDRELEAHIRAVEAFASDSEVVGHLREVATFRGVAFR